MAKNFLDTSISLYEKNAKSLNMVGLAIVGVLVLIFAYKFWYKEPREQEASTAVYHIQYLFGENDTTRLHYETILNGEPGKFRGAIFLADHFSDTKAGNLAKFYAGYVYYALGEYSKSLSYLEDCSINDPLISANILAVQGDVYAEQKDFQTAAGKYEKACYQADKNLLYAPLYGLRAGMLFTKANNPSKAKEMYEYILNKFPHESPNNETSSLTAPLVFEEIKRNLSMVSE